MCLCRGSVPRKTASLARSSLTALISSEWFVDQMVGCHAMRPFYFGVGVQETGDVSSSRWAAVFAVHWLVPVSQSEGS